MMRCRHLLVLALAATGCDTGHAVTPPDSQQIVTVDANMTQPPPNIDGGTVLVEYVTLDSDLQAAYGLPAGTTTITRMIAFFLDASPPSNPSFPPLGGCTNLAVTPGWPLIGSPRTELDMGTLAIRGPNTAGAIGTTFVPELTAGSDALGRAQDRYYQLVQPDATTLLGPGQSYTVNVIGTATIPDTTFDRALALPATFDVNTPGLEDNGPLVAGTDTNVFWTPTISPTLPLPVALIWLADVDGVPTHVCQADYSAGLFTIPGTAIAEYQQIAQARGLATNKMILQRDALLPNTVLLPNGEPNNPRALELLGVVSSEQLVDVN